MGINNKARRSARSKAKAKERARAKARDQARPGRSRGASGRRAPNDGAGHRGADRSEPLFTEAELARNLLVLAAQGPGHSDGPTPEATERLCSMPSSVVADEAEAMILAQIGALWEGGWQPGELARQGRIGCPTAAGARLVTLGIATDHANRRAATLDARWITQVQGLDLPEVDGGRGWVRRWRNDQGFERTETVTTIVSVLANLLSLPRLDVILPPPGSGWAGANRGRIGRGGGESLGGAEANPVLERIRALLAKAEATDFEAEATAFTAKAHELMTRHAIDAALVANPAGGEREHPVAIRVPIDAPYADAKSLLLQTVAEQGRCRAVFHTNLAMSTVVGFPDDVAAAEMLFTSLLVQAQQAMAEAAHQAPAGTRVRSRSYRSAFLLSFTDRIGDRLREIDEAVFAEAEAERGSGFLPVLRSRADTVDAAMADRFGDTVTSQVRRGNDLAGWAGGRVAADNAQLSFGDLTEDAMAI